MHNMQEAYELSRHIDNPLERLVHFSTAWQQYRVDITKTETDYRDEDALEEIRRYEAMTPDKQNDYGKEVESFHASNHEAAERIRREMDRLTLLTASASNPHTESIIDITLEDLREDYIRAMLARKQHRRNTSINVRNAIAVLIRHMGNKVVSSVTTADVE
jgi:hypothetical protein